MMLLKITGAVLVVAGCGSVGFRLAANHRFEEMSLQQLIGILEFMGYELQYRLTPLPQLCRQAGKAFVGLPGRVVGKLATELESQISPDIERCMAAVLGREKRIPPVTEKALQDLARTVGRFDLEGQLDALEAVRLECRRNLEILRDHRENRLRSYQTLGLCAGAALAILFI